MKLQYGLLLAMLLGSGPLLAAEHAGDAMQKSPAMDTEQEQAATGMETGMQDKAASESKGQAMAQSGFSSGSVMRSAFTTQIQDREPVDKVQKLDNENREVYYFTELRDMEGQKATHRWEYEGEVMAEVEFDVKGPRWRVWSSKRFVPDWTGEWTVSVVNSANEVIARDTLQYVPESQDAPANNMPEENTGDMQ